MAETQDPQPTSDAPQFNAHDLTAAWPKAHASAVEALAGVGANEPAAKHQLHRQRASEAAHAAFQKAGINPKRVRASITWGKDKPMVTLEVVTMEGQRFEGGSQADQRMTMPAEPAVKTNPPEAPKVPEKRAAFFAGLVDDEEKRDAQAAAMPIGDETAEQANLRAFEAGQTVPSQGGFRPGQEPLAHLAQAAGLVPSDVAEQAHRRASTASRALSDAEKATRTPTSLLGAASRSPRSNP